MPDLARSRADRGVGLVVDVDPSVWLVGPLQEDASVWTAGALAAVCSDFGVAAGGAEQALLRDVLQAFATAELGCDVRFLRLRSAGDVPLVAMLHVWTPDDTRDGTDDGTDDGPGRGDGVLAGPEPGTRWYDADPDLVVVDEALGLRRSVRYAVDDDGRATGVVRYHRRVAALSADVVLSSAGADPRTTALALADLDGLARAVRLLDAEGEQW